MDSLSHRIADGCLAGGRAMAVLGVSDAKRARAFYEGVLKLVIVSSDDYALVADAGGVRVRLTMTREIMPAPYTVLGFEVPDAAAACRGLAAAGVVFELYNFLGSSQTPDGIWTAPNGTRVAWFKDPDGNLLSISDR